ncbi:MAG: DNA internalization-related competence protein ComEC/Rec2 [Lachnospiraceae bacterium]|nr:DNA internalization-related competence protein ComEC/Rec2 [Lachnospiraceae bacterium]
MRRPLAWACTVIVVLIYIGVGCGILPFKKNVTLPEDGSFLTITGRVQNITDKYIVIKSEDSGTFMAYMDNISGDLKLGEELTIRGRASIFSPAMNPGGFDAPSYYASKGIDARLWDASIISNSGEEYRIREKLRRFRLMLENRLYSICPEKEASILCDLLLGDKEGIDEKTEELYKNNGIAHILSISGLHISILGIGFFELLRKIRVKQIPAAMCAMCVLALYGIMTGMSISAVRAIGSFAIRMLSYPAKRTADPLTSLMLMASLTLIIHPAYAFQAGFLLSYGAALGIHTFLPAFSVLMNRPSGKEIFYEPDGFRKRLKNVTKKTYRIIKSAFISSFGIILFTLPIQLYFFYKVSVYSVILNLLILPCMSILVFSAMVSLIPGLGIAASISCFLLKIFERLCTLAETLPFHSWNPGRPGKAAIGMYYFIISLIIIASKVYKVPKVYSRARNMDSGSVLEGIGSYLTSPIFNRFASIVTTFACFLMLLIINLPFPARNTSTQLYVGQGNCNVTITDAGEIYIFDGGSTSEKSVGEYTIMPYLRYNGLSVIDGIFLSHSDEDHVNGILELVENSSEWEIEIKGVYITAQMRSDNTDNTENTDNLLKTCEDAGISVTDIKAGDSWQSGNTVFSCLHPASDYSPEDPNSGSMVIMIDFNLTNTNPGFTLLIPGDVQGSGEEALTETIRESLGSKRLDVYITAHHGSSGTTTLEFLEVARPRLAINSAGFNNRYGHPNTETLERLQASGCAYMTLYETGAVTLDFTEKEIKVSTFL